jgi:hypothetical protein
MAFTHLAPLPLAALYLAPVGVVWCSRAANAAVPTAPHAPLAALAPPHTARLCLVPSGAPGQPAPRPWAEVTS